MSVERILIVEDETIVALDIKNALKKLGFEISGIASNAKDALESIEKSKPDIILMDINLEGEKDGIELAYDILKQDDIPIIYLTAYSDDETVKKALTTNPVGYLVKPFKLEELKCTIRLGLHKKTQIDFNAEDKSTEYLGEGFSFDFDDEILYLDKMPIKLSTKEKKLLKLLYGSKNNIVPMHTIEYTIWPDELVSQSTVRTLLYRLRTKLNHKLIETIPSFGCKINIEN